MISVLISMWHDWQEIRTRLDVPRSIEEREQHEGTKRRPIHKLAKFFDTEKL